MVPPGGHGGGRRLSEAEDDADGDVVHGAALA
jgi:hypothetical protein